MYVYRRETVYWNMSSLLDFIFEETDLPSLSIHQLPRVPQLRVGLHGPLSHPRWDFGLLDCVKILCMQSQPLSLHVCNSSLLFGKQLSLPATLTAFSFPLSQGSLGLESLMELSHLERRFRSLLLLTGCKPELITVYCKGSSMLRVERCSNL